MINNYNLISRFDSYITFAPIKRNLKRKCKKNLKYLKQISTFTMLIKFINQTPLYDSSTFISKIAKFFHCKKSQIMQFRLSKTSKYNRKHFSEIL